MAIVAGAAALGIGLQTIGQLQALQEKKKLAKLHKKEIAFQAKTSSDLFNFTFPNFVQQQEARRGAMASQIAKRGVAFEGSALTMLSEQARVDSVNQSLQKFQQALQQRSFQVESRLTDRTIQQAKTEQIFTLASGLVGGGSQFV